ncbi:MAG: hypothetical protein V8Q79_01690 [Christensenellales bacterium]
MVARLGNAPNGSSNKQQVEFTLIDDKEQMKIFRSAAYNRMTELAEQGIYPEGFEGIYYEDMKNWKKQYVRICSCAAFPMLSFLTRPSAAASIGPTFWSRALILNCFALPGGLAASC